MSTMFKLLWMNKITFMLSVSESNSHVVLSDLLMHAEIDNPVNCATEIKTLSFFQKATIASL